MRWHEDTIFRPMTISRLLPFLFLLMFPPVSIPAQEPPIITIRKGEQLEIAPGEFNDATVKKVLENDLSVSGYFRISEANQAGFVASGKIAGDGLEGRVVDRSGNTVIQSSYFGSPRSRAHKFADDIVETITGKPGIADSKIAFVATSTGRKEIYTADYDGANIQQLTRDNSISVGPDLSADGSRLAYTGYQSGYADIYLINLASGSRNRIIKFPGTNTGAAFSPDGGRLAVSLSKDGNPELYVTSTGGNSPRRVTRTRGAESSPSWSPNGDEIVYSYEQNGGPQLYRVSPDGGTPRRLDTGHGYCTEPNWSPDGKKIAFNVRQGGFQVAVLDLGTGQTTVVTSGGNYEDPVWGADSRHILCSGGNILYLLDAQTGSKTKIVEGLGKISEPTWSR
jgi:TolB protein